MQNPAAVGLGRLGQQSFDENIRHLLDGKADTGQAILVPRPHGRTQLGAAHGNLLDADGLGPPSLDGGFDAGVVGAWFGRQTSTGGGRRGRGRGRGLGFRVVGRDRCRGHGHGRHGILLRHHKDAHIPHDDAAESQYVIGGPVALLLLEELQTVSLRLGSSTLTPS